MKTLKFQILTLIIVVIFITISCNQTNNSDNEEKALIEKENELLKKENALLKKEQELSQKQAKQKDVNSNTNKLDFLKKLNGKYPFEAKLFDNWIFR